ncbi:MAG: LysR family transcriptional regulator [Devosia sp.]|nr:LysR family transcriptional regulator [Devosia sp.]
MRPNLRHLRAFLAVADHGSVTRAAELCHVSQPAVTQAVGKLERQYGASLFQRTPQGLFATSAGQTLAARVRRAFQLLDPALTELAPRLRITASSAQLCALIAMRESENFTLAARRMGLAQPTVHRAITQLEQEAARSLFERTSYGMVATRPAQALAHAAQLAFAELDQADADLAELLGREVGRIVVGAMPLSRSYILPRTIARFRERRPTLPIKALEGPYDDLVAGLRRGEIDVLVGALRDPPPIGDVVQQPLFEDELVVVARPDHPLLSARKPMLADLAGYPWVVAIAGTPTRNHFDRLFAPLGSGGPRSLVETGSMILMRELLRISDHLGFISRLQIEADLGLGAIVRVPFETSDTFRPIGLTMRAGWLPTRAQQGFLDDLRNVIGR